MLLEKNTDVRFHYSPGNTHSVRPQQWRGEHNLTVARQQRKKPWAKFSKKQWEEMGFAKKQICNATFCRTWTPRPRGKPSLESNPSSKKIAHPLWWVKMGMGSEYRSIRPPWLLGSYFLISGDILWGGGPCDGYAAICLIFVTRSCQNTCGNTSELGVISSIPRVRIFMNLLPSIESVLPWDFTKAAARVDGLPCFELCGHWSLGTVGSCDSTDFLLIWW